VAAVLLAVVFNRIAGRSTGWWGAIGVRAVVTLALLIGGCGVRCHRDVLTFDYPQVGRFNARGGPEPVQPEFVALVLGLVIYTAARKFRTRRGNIRTSYQAASSSASPSRGTVHEPEADDVRRAHLRARSGKVKKGLDTMVQLAMDGMTMLVVTHEMTFARQVASRPPRVSCVRDCAD
jgi:hypothetical protein